MAATPLDAAWVSLSLLRSVGARTMRALLRRFGSPAAVLAADPAALRAVPGIGPKTSAAIAAIDAVAIEAALLRWQTAGVGVLTLDDLRYPPRLHGLDDAPPTLFCLPNTPPPAVFSRPAAAVIGTRRPSPRAHEYALMLGALLAESGWAVVSGLAYGIDKAAHLGALAVPHGVTIGVLGGGLLADAEVSVYPLEHRDLAQAVIRRGALLTETRPDAQVSAPTLVARNRIITGLSDAVLVVETNLDGGAMHAARFAIAQGRPLYTFDLPVSGNRALLTQGAQRIPPDPDNLDWLRVRP